VCGSDGVTYINDCVARCQGVGIKTWAPCNEEYPLDRGEKAAALAAAVAAAAAAMLLHPQLQANTPTQLQV
jgi:hypothetical protein